MSSFNDRFRTELAAIWPKDDTNTDGYGGGYLAPITVKVCRFTDDKIKRDRNGQEFVPTGAFDMGYKPNFGDLILVIDAGHTPAGSPEDGALEIRAIKEGTELRGAKDYVVYTG